MFLSSIKKYNKMVLTSIFFFYIGCVFTLNFLGLECADGLNTNKRKIEENSFNKVEYAVVILSAKGQMFKRDGIRNTWKKFANQIKIKNGTKYSKWNFIDINEGRLPDFIKLWFVIATKSLDHKSVKALNEENMKHNDLLLLSDMKDSYKTLAMKMMHSLKWMNDNLKNLKYLIKCDDDSFVRIDLIIEELETHAPNMNSPSISKYVTYKKDPSTPRPSYKGLYWGFFRGDGNVYRKGKWEEQTWFLCDRYLPYAMGGGYVISRNIVKYIARNIDSLSCYNSEDVSMGVWTAALSQINRVHDIRFDTEYKSRGCEQHMLVRHKQSPRTMAKMYDLLVQSEGIKLCNGEIVSMSYFHYNWTVSPSKCCARVIPIT